MYFPDYRPRRTRKTETIRRMVRETVLSVDDLIYPMFVVPGTGVKKEISSLPGQYHLSVDKLVEDCKAVRDLGIPAVILFGLPETKDELGSSGFDDNGRGSGSVAGLETAGGRPDADYRRVPVRIHQPRALRHFERRPRWTMIPPWITWPARR